MIKKIVDHTINIYKWYNLQFLSQVSIADKSKYFIVSAGFR